jgi:hypothetical protein
VVAEGFGQIETVQGENETIKGSFILMRNSSLALVGAERFSMIVCMIHVSRV